jgi:prepilin-type N-terminal cleavage/methylation domain-containing protein
MKNITRNNKNKGFTLIEIMVAIAIVGITSAMVLVSMNSFGAKARSSKALAQLSSAIPSMVSCWGNSNDVKNPTSGGGGAICKQKASDGGADITSYGYWPSWTGDLDDYGFNLSPGDTVLTSPSSWKISVHGDQFELCCNAKMNSCGNIGADLSGTHAGAACSLASTW